MKPLLPSPRLAKFSGDRVRLTGAESDLVQAHGPAAASACRRLADWAQPDFAILVNRPGKDPGAKVHLGLVQELVADCLADPSWLSSPAFAAPLGSEQGYLLDLSPHAVVVGAFTEHGLQNGAATLAQLLERQGGDVWLPCGRVEDWPDFRFRAADWLLNAEINRWGYERGDGREALLARMKRKLDLAARHKINLIWFDGFGWNPDRAPGYAAFVRELSDYARARHIRLAHAGYGGGYGFAYQKHFIYESPYQGRIFENRTRYPDGEVYDCVGHPRYPTSWRYGTCLSNAALADLKTAELAAFVRECRPGMLYIHDVDTGTFDGAREGWKRRCARCRERWPDDEMASDRGAAAAYAAWFARAAAAVNAVRSEDGGYVAARDCEIVFVGPVYSGCDEADAVWVKECDYFALVSRLLGPVPNVQFGIREQFVSDEPADARVRQAVGRTPRVAGTTRRVPMLRDKLSAVGHGHGILVVAFVGGDNYFSDQLVSSGPALQRHYLGADTVYTKTIGSVAEPAQLLCAEYGWRADAAGAYPLASSRSEALALLRRCKTGKESCPEIFGEQGLLRRACDMLHGAQAGPLLAQVFTAGIGEGLFPVAAGWGSVSREAPRLLGGAEADPASRAQYWLRRETVTALACADVAQALLQALPSRDVRGDVEWLQDCLEVGRRLCRALSACWTWTTEKGGPARARAEAALEDLHAYLSAYIPSATTDPVGGDIAVWRHTLQTLRAFLAR